LLLGRFVRLAVSTGVIVLVRSLTAVRAIFDGITPDATPRVYFANHSSHGDFALVWTALPPRARARARPVAAADYWLASRIRRVLGKHVFEAVLIDRNPVMREQDPVQLMVEALDEAASLIVFPEGTRNTTESELLPFKSGLYHLARARPDIDLVPVWIHNLGRVMPKGGLVPVPLLCTVTFGPPVRLLVDEGKDTFLVRSAFALASLSPKRNGAAA
jgi:1-acyl-sn-glycerol-3-phosphate acyltransferase